uniref:Uncharacterized protein n=1 Tax=Biomphalaria glabrata TaxID=6526 RepID=A0A2C9LSE6_BIOGL
MAGRNIGYECDDSGVFEIDLKLPNGTVKRNYNFITFHTVKEEKERIVLEEQVVGLTADKLVMIKHTHHGKQDILCDSEILETYDLDECSLIELELESRAKEYDGRRPNEKHLNIDLR